jgi:hypothetical protein
MSKQLHVLVSYRSFNAQVKESARHTASSSPLTDMTQIFRMNFWQVFDTIYVYNVEPAAVQYMNVSCTLTRVRLFYSGKTRLNRTEDDDYILYYTLSLPETLAASGEAAVTTIATESLSAKEDVLRQAQMARLVDGLRSGYKGHSAWISEDFDPSFADEVAALAAFYFYAFILMLRIERHQITADITPQLDVNPAIHNHIISQRIRLINLERYFLTQDRTNNAFLKEICTRLEKKYRLLQRYERASARHSAFEHHMDNTSKALNSQRVSSLSNMIALLTITSIPLAAMQLLFGINLAGSIYLEWHNVLSHHMTYVVFGIGVLAVLVPLLLLRMIDAAHGKPDR